MLQVETPIFEWPYKQGEDFSPTLLRYHSVQANAIGLHLDCSDCHIELAGTSNFTKLYPFNIWRPKSACSWQAFHNRVMTKTLTLMGNSI